MIRKKDKTTIIFINNGKSLSKPIQVPSSYVQHWKKIAVGISVGFLFLLGLIVYLAQTRSNVQMNNQHLVFELEKINNLKQKHFLDTASLKKYYQSVDKQLLMINKYLKVRGLKPLKKSVGGEERNEITSVEETGSFYKSYLDKMIKLISFTPMGYPHFGNITSVYGYRENPFTGETIENHKGLDIKGSYGDPVKSTANGRVTFANHKGEYGKFIVIRHDNGFETCYGHLSKILVKVGQEVSAGQLIGKIGSTGRSTGPHLHYEIRRNGKHINPKSYLTLE